ncbi:sensor histidine kinase [Halobacteriovorax sp. YZS-1-1]|uniref:sensor histidine kinase n=1 Tax=unclassified Halobacteriovorax TaxID=2639665 RepID=UPI00399C1157
MSVDEYIVVTRYVTIFAFSYFLYQASIGAYTYRKHLNVKAFWPILMCLSAGAYAVLIAVNTHVSDPKLSNFLLITYWFFAYWTYYCYLKAIEGFFGYDLKKLWFSKFFCVAHSVYVVIGGFLYLFTSVDLIFKPREIPPSTLFTKALNLQIYPSLLVVLTGVMGLVVILYSTIVVWKELNRRNKNEYLFKMGLIVTLFASIWDTSIGTETIGYLVPIYYLGYVFESMRFNIYYQDLAFTKMYNLEKDMVKLSKVAQFGFASASIAHDIRNHLFVLNTANNRLEKELLEDQRRYTEKLRKHIAKILEVTDLYMNIFKKNYDSHKERIKISDVTMEAIDLVQEKIDKDKVKVELEIDDFDIDGNETELSLCLVNLIKNSLEEIKTTDTPWIKVITSSSQRFIKIVDSGNGIPRDQLKNIFEMGKTTKKDGSGFGVGLAITKQIIENSGYQLLVEEDSENTTFVINF